MDVWETVWNSEIIDASPEFPSSLRIYDGPSFETLETVLLYKAGEEIYIEHVLDTIDWAMSVKWVILSASTDPVHMVYNISSSLRTFSSSPGSVKFGARAELCSNCYVMVWSATTTGGRLLSESDNAAHFAYSYKRIFVDVAGHEEMEILAELVFPTWVVIMTAFLVSFASAGVSQLLVQRVKSKHGEGATMSIKTYFVVEIIDAALDATTYLLCRAEGDLELVNGRGVAIAIEVSVATSIILVLVEMGIFCKMRGRNLSWMIGWLVSLHILGEDSFQLVCFAFIQVSNAQSGLGTKYAILCALAQNSICLLAKFVGIFERLLEDEFAG